MALDLVALFVSKFTNSPRVLANLGHAADLLRSNDLSDIGNEKLANSVSGPHDHLSINRNSRRSNRSSSLIWHCQMIRTLHPLLRNLHTVRESRFMLPSILRSQNSLFVFGLRALGQPLWPCQKHPCTKISFFCPSSIKSGVPGILPTLLRYRQFRRRRHLFKSRSGDVLLPLTFAIISLRFSCVNVSVIPSLFHYQHGQYTIGNPRCQHGRHSIADLLRDLDFRSGKDERIRKRLKSRRFPMGNGAMLAWMQVTPLFRFEELCSDRKGRSVPPKTPKKICTTFGFPNPTCEVDRVV